MYTKREFARIGLYSVATLAGLAALPAAGQELNPDQLAALLDKEDMTKEDHLKLVDHYAAEAKQFEEAATRHDSMAVRYRRGRHLPPKVASAFQAMPRHCENLAKSLRNAAKASQELAKAHRAMADETN